MLLALCAVLLSCRDKDKPLNGDNMTPPLGLVFSVPSGIITFFDPVAFRIIAQDTLEAAVVAAAIPPGGDRLVIANGVGNWLTVLSLPGLEEISSDAVGGALMDVCMEPQARVIYAITHNGNLWRYTSAPTPDFDTLEVLLYPRRMAIRPPHSTQVWVVCEGNSALYVVNLGDFAVRDSVNFTTRPSDVVFSPDGERAYVGLCGEPGMVMVYNANNLEQHDILQAGRGPFELAVSSDGDMLAAADSLTGELYLWNLNTLSQWTVPMGQTLVSVHWQRDTHLCFVLLAGANRVLRLPVGVSGPGLADTLAIRASAREMVFWELSH